jgi:putative ABC transport system ATP-binding protein
MFPNRIRTEQTMTLAILARSVHKSFAANSQRVPILKGAGLGIAIGEIVFLVGPSGSGKTTLLSILGCLLTPDEGSVQVLGQDVSRLGPKERTAFRRQRLSFIFQNFNLFPTLSALDNVALSLAMRGQTLPAATQNSLALLDQVGLNERAHLRPAQLSTGECQRVSVARALAAEPALLFADEPTASLDATNGQLVMKLLTDLVRQRGTTLVLVTHDERIFSYADRILRLEDGRLTHGWSVRPPATAAGVGNSGYSANHRSGQPGEAYV